MNEINNNEEQIIFDSDQADEMKLQQEEMIKNSIVFYEYTLEASVQQIKKMVDQENQEAMGINFICSGLLSRFKMLRNSFDENKYEFEHVISSCQIIEKYVKDLVSVCYELPKDKKYSGPCRKKMLSVGLKMYEREKLKNDPINEIIKKYETRLKELNDQSQKGKKIEVVLFAGQQLINDLKKCKEDLDKCQNQCNFEDLIEIYSKVAKNETDLEILLPEYKCIKDDQFLHDKLPYKFIDLCNEWSTKSKYADSKNKQNIQVFAGEDDIELKNKLSFNKTKIMKVGKQAYKYVFETLNNNIKSKMTIDKSNKDKIETLRVLSCQVYLEFSRSPSGNSKSFGNVALSYKIIANQLRYLIAIFNNICLDNLKTLSHEQQSFLTKRVWVDKVSRLLDKILSLENINEDIGSDVDITDILISMGKPWTQDLYTLLNLALGLIDRAQLGIGLEVNNIKYLEIHDALDAMINILEKVKPENLA